MGEGPSESRRRLVGTALTWRLRSDSGSKARALRQREKGEGWALAGPGNSTQRPAPRDHVRACADGGSWGRPRLRGVPDSFNYCYQGLISDAPIPNNLHPVKRGPPTTRSPGIAWELITCRISGPSPGL